MKDLIDFLATWSNWTGPNGILIRTFNHLAISVVAVLVASVIALPIAIVLGHRRKGGFVAVAAANLGRAIPSLAILALALPLSIKYGFGLGAAPTLVALVILAIPPLFANTYTGVASVEPALVDAARGQGLTEWQALRQLELPLSAPFLMTGVRIALVQVLATAALGALVAFSGLGSFIIEGFAQFDDGKTLTGALLTAVLAVSAESVLSRVQRRLTPWVDEYQ
ncbi:MAG: ABC transporter permease [Microthrixaceae bacterium]|nr:ABC transporter permease [Microthrixaceae bacterium]